jgi:hypothetical protein
MERLQKMLSKQHSHNMILCVVMAVFIVFNIQVPDKLADMVDSLVGRVVLAVGVIYLFMHDHTVGAVALVAAYVLLKRSTIASGSYAVNNYLPSEKIKNTEFTAWNQFPRTLEEDVVANMAPHGDGEMAPPSFKPLLSKNENAEVLE